MRYLTSTAIVAFVTVGCANSLPTPKIVVPPPLNIRIAPDIIHTGATHRTSRYVTESSVPARQVRDVLSSEVNVNIPNMPNATVGEGLNFLLSQSGYGIRSANSYAEKQLYLQPLPIMHMNMGYMSVRQALQVISGDPWILQEDVVKRELGFSLREGYIWADPSSTAKPSPAMNAKTLTLSSSPETSEDSKSLLLSTGTSTSLPHQYPSAVIKDVMTIQNDVIADANTTKYYVVPMGQSYLSSLRQWVQDEQITNVAWDLGASTQEGLEKVSTNGQTFKATSFNKLVFNLSKEIGQPLYLYEHGKVAAMHSYPGLVDITWVSGSSLKSAVSNVVTSFNWKWDDANWLALDDYGFITPYPVVSPKGDIAHALDKVVDGYPVQAQLLYGTQQAFISEKQ